MLYNGDVQRWSFRVQIQYLLTFFLLGGQCAAPFHLIHSRVSLSSLQLQMRGGNTLIKWPDVSLSLSLSLQNILKQEVRLSTVFAAGTQSVARAFLFLLGQELHLVFCCCILLISAQHTWFKTLSKQVVAMMIMAHFQFKLDIRTWSIMFRILL